MSATIDQKSYLQKYLSGSSNDKKKKKKKVAKGKGFKIIDDDIDLTKLRPLEGDELDVYGEGEDAPQVAGIIDERPEEVRKMEQFKTSSKWKIINHDDGFNSKLQIEEIKKDIKEVEKDNEIIFGKMYSDSEDEKKNDSDASPPRKNAKTSDQIKKSTKEARNSDSDISPPRKSRSKADKRSNKDYDSDLSPPRKHSDKSRERKNASNEQKDDSDASPPRKNNHQTKSKERRKPSRWGHFEPETRRSRSNSPDRRKNKRKSQSPSKSKRRSPESRSNSPDRRKNKRKSQSPSKRRSPDSDQSPPRKRRPDRSDSPPRKTKHDSLKKRRKSPDSDASPPRKRKSSPLSSKHKSRRKSSDSDFSPPRKSNKQRNNDCPPPSNKKMEKTLEGKMAGLQDARQLRVENEQFRKREEEAFSRMTDEVSGRNAAVVSRKGKRETSEDRQKLKQKQEKQKELDEKYKKWSRGLKQTEDQEARVQQFMHEASKPLARFRDDRDLEASLKQEERDGDPMLEYMRERRREKGELGPAKPMYKGNFPPNRFNLRPGHRWDGVDRSNGYENKYFQEQSKKRALEEDAYKWSTEDL